VRAAVLAPSSGPGPHHGKAACRRGIAGKNEGKPLYLYLREKGVFPVAGEPPQRSGTAGNSNCNGLAGPGGGTFSIIYPTHELAESATRWSRAQGLGDTLVTPKVIR
jgi:hypothetical protein